MVLADGAAHWATPNANTSQGPCHLAVVGRIAVPAARLVWAVVHGAVDDNRGMLVAARAGAQMTMCPEPGQEYALAGAMQAAGYQYMKLSWAVDDTDGLPQVAAPPLGMFGYDVDDFSGGHAAPDNDDNDSPDADQAGSAESSVTRQQPTPATGSSSTAVSAHRSGAGNMASASVSGH
eukprot:3711-Heterococcus_DN1.PRE.2